jgi:hypothetical protein
MEVSTVSKFTTIERLLPDCYARSYTPETAQKDINLIAVRSVAVLVSQSQNASAHAPHKTPWLAWA